MVPQQTVHHPFVEVYLQELVDVVSERSYQIPGEHCWHVLKSERHHIISKRPLFYGKFGIPILFFSYHDLAIPEKPICERVGFLTCNLV